MGIASESFFNKGVFKSLFGREITPIKMGGSYFLPVGQSNNIFSGNSYLKDFQEIPELNAIINIRANAMASWKLSAVNKKSGEPTTSTDSIIERVNSPNWFQSGGEFWRQSSLFHDIWGNEYLYFLTPTGRSKAYYGLFTLDPSRVMIKYNSDSQYFLESDPDKIEYYYKVPGKTKPLLLERENIIHLNDNRVDLTPDTTSQYDSGSFIKGTSKIQSLQAPLQNIRAAYKKRNIILGMPIGVMSNANKDATGYAVPMNPTEKDAAQQALRDHGALPILTNLAVSYSDMNVNAQNMGLFDEVREDVGRICDAYGVPFEILANQKGTTFTNLKEARKQMYEEGIIPAANEKADALNGFVKTGSKPWMIKSDYSHLPVFAEDIKQRAISLKQLVEALSKALADGAITVIQYQAELNKYGI